MSLFNKLPRHLGPTAVIAIAVVAALSAAIPIAATINAFADDSTDAASSSDAPQAQSSDVEANLPFLFAVYIVTWAAFFGHAFYMSRRQREMRREIAALRRLLERQEDAQKSESDSGSG
jgi:CcmD family protein